MQRKSAGSRVRDRGWGLGWVRARKNRMSYKAACVYRKSQVFKADSTPTGNSKTAILTFSKDMQMSRAR